MPEAETPDTIATPDSNVTPLTPPRRRTLLGHVIGATVAAGVLYAGAKPAAVKAGPDDELLALCLKLALISSETKRQEGLDADDDVLAVLDSEWWETAERINKIPALTADGLRFKASALRLSMERTACTSIGQTLATIEASGRHYQRLALSLVHDVLMMG